MSSGNQSGLSRPVALVTGAQQGIGAGIAVAFAEAGYDVAIHYLDDVAAADTVRQRCLAFGVDAALLQADLSDAQAAPALVDAAAAALGVLDVVVNNAAIFPRSDFLAMTSREWNDVIGVNLTASVFIAQRAAELMVRQGRAGSIVMTSSQAIRGVKRSAHYVATKGAIVALVRALALELAPQRIRVNAIAPGLIDTAQPRMVHTEEEMQERGRAVPLGRLGQPSDIAAMAVFLASDKASYITGQTVHVNGGSYMP